MKRDICIYDGEKKIIKVMIKDKLNKKQKYNLIGRKYTIKDNSYICEIVDGTKKSYHCNLYGQTMIIISQPYLTTVKSALRSLEQRMIKVKSMKTGFIYEVLFNEGWICK